MARRCWGMMLVLLKVPMSIQWSGRAMVAYHGRHTSYSGGRRRDGVGDVIGVECSDGDFKGGWWRTGGGGWSWLLVVLFYSFVWGGSGTVCWGGGRGGGGPGGAGWWGVPGGWFGVGCLTLRNSTRRSAVIRERERLLQQLRHLHEAIQRAVVASTERSRLARWRRW